MGAMRDSARADDRLPPTVPRSPEHIAPTTQDALGGYHHQYESYGEVPGNNSWSTRTRSLVRCTVIALSLIA
jgi:hypothetical protein